jgi:hypothetical protein
VVRHWQVVREGAEAAAAGVREAKVEFELEFLVDDEDQGLQLRELGQTGEQLAHIGLGDFPVEHRVADARVDAVRGSEGEAVDVVAHQGYLAHEAERPVQPLDEQVRFQQEDVAGQVDVLGRLAQGHRLVVVKHEVARFTADRRQRRRRLRVDVGEHQPLLSRCLLRSVGCVEDFVDSRFWERILPYHGPYLGRESLEVVEPPRHVVDLGRSSVLVVVVHRVLRPVATGADILVQRGKPAGVADVVPGGPVWDTKIDYT